MVLRIYLHNIWNYQVNFWNKQLSTQHLELRSMCFLLWIRVIMKSIRFNHYKLILVNLKSLSVFLTGYNVIFNVTYGNNKSIFIPVFEGAQYNLLTILPGAYEMESLNTEIKRNISDEGPFTEDEHPLTIKRNFSTLASIKKITPGSKWQISFIQEFTLRDLSGFKPTVIHDEYNLSDNPVDTLSFDKIIPGTDIAQVLIFESRRSG